MFAYWKWLSTRYFRSRCYHSYFLLEGTRRARKILSIARPRRPDEATSESKYDHINTCSYLLFRASRASTLEHARTAAAPTAQSNSDNDADVRLHRIRHRVIAVVTHKLVCYCNTRYIYRLCLCIYDVLLLLILYMLSN